MVLSMLSAVDVVDVTNVSDDQVKNVLNAEKKLESLFWFSVVWSIGGCLAESSRPTFEKFTLSL
jgi:hypothetical protein